MAIGLGARTLRRAVQGEFFPYREIASLDPAWWWFFPVAEDLAQEIPEGDLLRFWDESMLAKRGLLGDDQRPATDALPYSDSEDDPVAY
ncbi:MAG TPA: hypothetical protein VEM59_04475 [Acidimicrobiia bacterium]|nr:hypothetical protein [Acidimicrobiia bacterium]